jgi:antitoxin component of MazEF toxin-antitoxin module
VPKPAFDAAVRYPRSRIDKLGVKPGARVTVLGVDDPDFLAELKERGADVSPRTRAGSDIIFVAMTSKADLPRLDALRRSIKPEGAVWVIWPKGRREFREDDVRNHGPQAELVDVKVMAFSDTLSALKMVVPLAKR